MMPVPAELDLTLGFNGERWCTHVDGRLITATDIAELEDRIGDAVQNMDCFAPHRVIRVRLHCDTSVLPTWLRQYHAHYFNSTLTVHKPVPQASTLPA